MRLIAKVASGLGLVLTVGPSIAVFLGALDLDSAKVLMLVGTLLWFASAPVWINSPAADASVSSTPNIVNERAGRSNETT